MDVKCERQPACFQHMLTELTLSTNEKRHAHQVLQSIARRLSNVDAQATTAAEDSL